MKNAKIRPLGNTQDGIFALDVICVNPCLKKYEICGKLVFRIS